MVIKVRNYWVVVNLKKKIKEAIIYIIVIALLVSTASIKLKKEEKNKIGKNIKLLTNNTVKEIDFEEYIKGVVSAEMPANFEEEALKAQAICARTYTINKIVNSNKEVHNGADICDNSAHCQAYCSKEDSLKKWEKSSAKKNWDKIAEAVDETEGKIITYQGNIISALFHSSSGGRTEDVKEVWGGTQYPYLVSVDSVGEEEIMSNFTEVKEFTIKEMKEILQKKEKKFKFNTKTDKIEILSRTNGDRVREIKFGNLKLSGTETRSLFGLRSANFEIELSKNKIIFTTKGYGHGAGMSQWGAQAMALEGKKYDEILKHYYTGVEIEEYYQIFQEIY